ncbi:F-box protein [Candidatus Protochlamydia phocaeensis]|uniref:F-box protein n=1 Tax=Candidatus Protochlamydia phocaeensis TaxID=1414722 RepID=UPI000837B484|nr:F-box protein [Candidatus Protochlamydia phocaeensis]
MQQLPDCTNKGGFFPSLEKKEHASALIDLLPNEMLTIIFKKLDTLSQQRVACVCKKWNELLLSSICAQETKRLNCFIHFLLPHPHIRPYSTVEKNLKGLLSAHSILTVTHLKQVKQTRLKFEELLIAQLKTIQAQDLIQLRKSASHSKKLVRFIHLIDLSCLYFKLEGAKRLTNEEQKSEEIRSIIKALIIKEDWNKALEGADSLSNSLYRWASFILIIKALLTKGLVSKAIETATGLFPQRLKSMALQFIVKRLIVSNQVDKALEVVRLIHKEQTLCLPIGRRKKEQRGGLIQQDLLEKEYLPSVLAAADLLSFQSKKPVAFNRFLEQDSMQLRRMAVYNNY